MQHKHTVLIDFMFIYVLTNLLNASLCMHGFLEQGVSQRTGSQRSESAGKDPSSAEGQQWRIPHARV